MRFRSFEFNLRELAGSMGDFGTLLPLAIGYIVVNGLDPAGFLVMMGLANIVTGLVYRLPMPIEPMKVLAVMAIAQHWSPSMIYASGFAMGVVWLFLAATNLIGSQRLHPSPSSGVSRSHWESCSRLKHSNCSPPGGCWASCLSELCCFLGRTAMHLLPSCSSCLA